MPKEKLYQLIMSALDCYRAQLATSKLMMNSVRTRELEDVREAMRIVSIAYSSRPKRKVKRQGKKLWSKARKQNGGVTRAAGKRKAKRAGARVRG